MAYIMMRFPEGKSKALTLSYDDGVEQDVRLINIMKQHGLKGTFNLNSGEYKDPQTVYPEGQIHRRMSEEEVTNLYTDSGMEVVFHPQMFYLWGHSYEFEAHDNWKVIEEFADYMGGRDDIWYATNLEVYEYVEDYNRLLFSMDKTIIKNPTARDLYLDMDGTIVCIKTGKVKTVEQ